MRFCRCRERRKSRSCSSLYFRSEDRPRGALDVAFYPSTTLLFSADCVTSRTDNNDRGKKERGIWEKRKKKVAKWHECVYPFRLINKIIRIKSQHSSDFAIEVAACRDRRESTIDFEKRRAGRKERKRLIEVKSFRRNQAVTSSVTALVYFISATRSLTIRECISPR